MIWSAKLFPSEEFRFDCVDTAGIREALDEAESIGIRKSMEALADADLVLIVLDSSVAMTAKDQELMELVSERAAILIHNKVDIASSQITTPGFQSVKTSATTGQGIADLREEILRHVGEADNSGGGFLTNLRQQNLVKDSLSGLDAARTAVTNKVPHEMLLLDLYSCLRPLDEITGATTTDDILSLIFSQFCIGK